MSCLGNSNEYYESACSFWPFSSVTNHQPEKNELDLLEFICSEAAKQSTGDFLSKFEFLLDKYGIEAVLFLTSRRIQKTSGSVALGKKCVVRSRLGESKVEFRIRNGGELKKLRIDWNDIIAVEVGENYGLPLPTKFNLTDGESLDNCFLRLTTKKVGDFDVLVKSQALRDACLRGFRLVALTRADRNIPTGGGASKNFV